MRYKKSFKLHFCAPYIWRQTFLFHQNALFHCNEKFLMARSSVILPAYVKTIVNIYNGRFWQARMISRWNVGFKLGELTWNRKFAIYKAKRLRKQKKLKKLKK